MNVLNSYVSMQSFRPAFKRQEIATGIASKIHLLLVGQIAGLTISCFMALWQSNEVRSENDHAYKVITLAHDAFSVVSLGVLQYQSSAIELAQRQKLMEVEKQNQAAFVNHMQTLIQLAVTQEIRTAIVVINDDYQKYTDARFHWLALMNHGQTAESDAYWELVLLPSERKTVAALASLAARYRADAFAFEEQRDAVLTTASVQGLFVTVSALMAALIALVLMVQRFGWARFINLPTP